MVGGRLGERIKAREDLIKRACSVDLKAHKAASGKPYLYEKSRVSSEAIFRFSGSGTVEDWFSGGKPFGETGPEVDLRLFPSLRSIGTGEVAVVNRTFLDRFQAILSTTSFEKEVKKAAQERKQIVFTGHSSGGPVAILATLWFLEQYLRPNSNSSSSQIPPLCLTFGSPLVGNWVFPHALRRENWDDYFIHFIMRYDIVPRLMLAPLSSVGQELQPMLQFFNPKSALFGHDSAAMSMEAWTFFTMVMRSVSSVASHAACKTMGCTNSLLETVTSFVELSPYRPFGTCIFCTGNGKLVVVKNPDAVLQLLFYSSQLTCMAEGGQVAYKSLKEHLGYADELRESLEMQNVVYLDDHLRMLPLSSNGSPQGETATIGTALNDLGLSTRARLCLRAAGELQEQKQKNQEKINTNKGDIKAKLKSIQEYQSGCEVRGVDYGYYDAFKFQKEPRDFDANVKRLELAGMWDEIIEMLKRRELPDHFECQKEWIELGTEYRRLVEPLDIANYYRHLKNEDTGPYLIHARPKRYRYTQRWLEHAERMPQGSSSESCFWATVEELKNRTSADMNEEILHLEKNVSEWFKHRKIGSDVFLAESTFSKWWKTLPRQHLDQSCLRERMNKP